MSFEEDMAFASSCEELALLAYRHLWPGCKPFGANDENNMAQRYGCDRAVALANADIVSIDEKIRRIFFQGDVLFEYQHFHPNGQIRPGWIEEHKNIQFVNHIYVPHRLGVLVPWRPPQQAYQIYGARWKKSFREVIGETRKKDGGLLFNTRSIAVPVKMLKEAGVMAQVYSIPFPATDSIPPPRSPPSAPRQGNLW